MRRIFVGDIQGCREPLERLLKAVEFRAGRDRLLPVGDLGVCKGMKIAYGLRTMPTPKRARKIGAAWSPYASVASWYMWRVADTVTPD